MIINITMYHLDDIVIKQSNLDALSSVSFECYGSTLTFNLLAQDNYLYINSSEGLCVAQNGEINLLDIKEDFVFPLGTGFTLIYPALDMMTKFDFNY